MSIRRITVQYIGNMLLITKLERDVVYIITADGRTFVDAIRKGVSELERILDHVYGR